jgi:GDP-mannose 6-dehydrogenase
MSKISIFGLGYVGTVSAACLAKLGHEIIGVDKDANKVNLIGQGTSPVIEKGISELISEAVLQKQLCATVDTSESIAGTDISLICVGTPSRTNGSLDLSYVEQVCRQIGDALQSKDDYHVIAVRSTVLPGSTRQLLIKALEQYSGKKSGLDFGICFNPEFLREGTAVHDFMNPPKTVIGQLDIRSGDIVAQLYDELDAPLVRTDIETAEMVKYVDNTWHATKICFANEIGNICRAYNIDSHKVMDIFCLDTKLNLSDYYLKPGFAFGGSCLPKDVRALTYEGRRLDLNLPLLNSILSSNKQQVETGLKLVMESGNKKIGVLGFSFKAGTDDLRESPLVEVIERLLGKGYDIKIYDKNVKLAQLIGSNKEFLLDRIPHICNLMVDDIKDILDHAETIIIGNKAPEFRSILDQLRQEQCVVDLVRITDKTSEDSRYRGICW